MVTIDREAPLRFLQTAYRPDDWVAVFLRSYDTGRTCQRVGPISLVGAQQFQAWLRAQNAQRFNVYVSANTVAPAQRARRREFIQTVRHLLLDADGDVPGVLAAIGARRDVPQPSYVLQTSSSRAHVLWRVQGFSVAEAEAVQRHLARELGTDPAATSAVQLTRIPGLFNHKYRPGYLVTIDYSSGNGRYTPADFPEPPAMAPPARAEASAAATVSRRGASDRARRYVSAIPPAIQGQHGDLETFRACCRLVRGFALSDAEALEVLADWNARCEPPWSERELLAKLRHARRYGREPVGGLLEAQP
jgi:DNA primase RepB-like protein